jgi:hypothetical protein
MPEAGSRAARYQARRSFLADRGQAALVVSGTILSLRRNSASYCRKVAENVLKICFIFAVSEYGENKKTGVLPYLIPYSVSTKIKQKKPHSSALRADILLTDLPPRDATRGACPPIGPYPWLLVRCSSLSWCARCWPHSTTKPASGITGRLSA